MKKQFISLLSAVALFPAFSASAVTGSGTASDPYLIATADDLQKCWELTKARTTVYFEQTADIDMSGVTTWHAFAGFNGDYTRVVNYDGNFHLIKNFAPADRGAEVDNGYYCTSVFGVLSGTVKNLGVVDANVKTTQGAGILGGYAGHSTGTAAFVENVFVTGKVETSYYGGGMFGTTGNNVTIKNSYANVDIIGTGDNRQIGCITGRTNNAVFLENVYAAGTITSAAPSAGGLVCGGGSGNVTAKGVVAFNAGVEGATALGTQGQIVIANTDETKAEGIAEVEKWAYFSPVAESLPQLSWAVAPETDAIRQIWITPTSDQFIGAWGTGDNPRFATAYDGHMYTVDQKNTYIAEITANGLQDLYQLAETPDKTLFGTAISADEAGNFLLGTHFTTRPTSSLEFGVYVAKTGKVNNFTLPVPDGWNIGRLDCLGRVLGDLTSEAYFMVAPETGNYTSAVRVIKVTGDGTAPTAMEDVTDVNVDGNLCQQNVAQPAYHKLAEAQAAGAVNDFYYSSVGGGNSYYAGYVGGTLSTVAPDMELTTVAANNGFDTFVAGGKRYFVRNYLTSDMLVGNKNNRPMSFVITDENGDAVATWFNHDYVYGVYGYSSIVTEPLADGTVNIYIYNSGNTAAEGGAAAMLNFDPAKAGEPVKPEIPTGDTVDNPYKISTPDDLLKLAAKRTFNPFYVTLENDLDMTGLSLETINVSGAAVHFDGKQHVIKNLTITEHGGSAALFDYFNGSIRNLGLVDVNVKAAANSWGVTGTLIGYVGMSKDVTGDVLVENCFATGAAGSTSFYAGGLVAGIQTGSKLTVRNCYANVSVAASKGAALAGGLVGPCNDNTTLVVENCFAAGAVSSTGVAGGLVYGVGAGTATISLSNVVAWNKSITGTTVAAICGKGSVNAADAYAWDGISGVTVTDGKTTAELQAIVTAWTGFNDKLNDGMPVLAWQEANGESELIIPGSKEHPYLISTVEDLQTWGAKMGTGMTYFSIENDIDMSGVEYTVPLTSDFVGHYVNIEGNGHVIKNLTVASGAYCGLIGILQGEVHNLGLENVNITGWCAGGLGGMVGNSNYKEGVTRVDNCFVTGTVVGQGGYAAAFGSNSGNLVLTNSYSNVAVSGNNPYGSSGLVSVYGGNTTIENVYVAGAVSGSLSAGILASNPTTSVCTIKNAAILCPTIDGTNAYAVSNLGTTEGVSVSDKTLVNGAPVDGAKSEAEVLATVTSWVAFHNELVDGMPILEWQYKTESGIFDAEIEEVETEAPVYYNLQGVQVANPDGGIYIVRRGNKVTKELVR